ncbi:hypothetical protein V6N12_058789 [Hibiscus sabdariffa]|uniref:Uncharacterized protein n=1 Tax=Hibiscus sabdariffa TaxID=183260 RepID=A0ABR2EV27_9ROSI
MLALGIAVNKIQYKNGETNRWWRRTFHCDGARATIVDLRLRGSRHRGFSRLHRVLRQLHLHVEDISILATSQCLQKLPASNNKFTYNCDGHTFNYLVDNGFTYCVVAVESIGRQVPIAFLERISVDFTKRYGGGKAATAPANSLSKEFGPKLKEHMQHCNDHPEEISKIAKVKAQVSEVKGVMMENIEKVLDRGEKIELLVDKTENLRSQAQDFRQQGTQMRRKMWFFDSTKHIDVWKFEPVKLNFENYKHIDIQ